MSATVWGPVFTVLGICLGMQFMSHGFLCLACWRSKFYFKCKSKYIKYILLVNIRNMFFIVRQDWVQIAAPLLSSCDLGQSYLNFLAHFFTWSLWAVNSSPQVIKESGDTGRHFIRTVASWDIHRKWSHYAHYFMVTAPSAWVLLIATNNGGEPRSYQREVGAKRPQRSLNCGVLCHVRHRWIPLTQVCSFSHSVPVFKGREMSVRETTFKIVCVYCLGSDEQTTFWSHRQEAS